MNRPVQGVLEGMAADPTPRQVNDRLLIAEAINACAEAHKGRVHAAWLRPFIPADVNPSYIGSTVNRLRLQGVLVATGSYAANGGGGKARNQTKRSPVWKRMRVITSEDVS